MYKLNFTTFNANVPKNTKLIKNEEQFCYFNSVKFQLVLKCLNES